MLHSIAEALGNRVATSLGQLISSISTPLFGETLMRSVHTTVGGDFCLVVKLKPGNTPECLFTGGGIPRQLERMMVRDYLSRFYRDDPALNRMCETPETSDAVVRPFDTPSDYTMSYRKRFFIAAGVSDKISTGAWHKDCLIYSSFYKLEPSRPFYDAEIDALSLVGPALSAAIFKHGNTHGSECEDLSHSRRGRCVEETGMGTSPFANLTERERTVCNYIVEGCTSEAISLRLDISINSVLCYRKRAYAKLGISSVNELFWIALRSVRHQTNWAAPGEHAKLGSVAISDSGANSGRRRSRPVPTMKVCSPENKTVAPGTGIPQPSTDLCKSCA
jgi:DNA-binding CsgD family transcriptional regulator